MKLAHGIAVFALTISFSHCQESSIRGGTIRKLQNGTQSIDAKNDDYETIEFQDLKIKSPGVLENDGGSGEIFVKETLVLDIFQGEVKIKENGELSYKPPDLFTGREIFQYTACLVEFPEVCDNAIVTIDVKDDPLRPNAVPVAVNDAVTVSEGETVKVLAPGIFSNDKVGTPSNPLVLCGGKKRALGKSVDTGDLDLNSDGSFTYTAPTCFTGDVKFDYQACYQDYKDMKSNTATVTITVKESADRPDKPDADSDSYEVLEGEKLDVSYKKGVLDNDDVDDGYDLFVKSFTKKSSSGEFQGDLEVDDDGGFTYQPVPGQLGTFEFEYEACVDGWDKCVDCDTSTAKISVLPNPSKPADPPSAKDAFINTTIGERLRANVTIYIQSDGVSAINVTGFEKSDNFTGILNTDSKGNFEYGNAPPGNESFVYTFCYTKWPDLCGKGNITLETTGLLSSVPELEIAGDNGDPSTAYPLSACQADCDEDSDCEDGLVCFHRGGTEVIPGCVGTDGNTFRKEDFCIDPATMGSDTTMNESDESTDEDTEDTDEDTEDTEGSDEGGVSVSREGQAYEACILC